MNKPKFSIALIARNEAETLPRMIGSLKEFQERGGEIWVLDTGSTDNTVEVAKGLGCKVEAVGDKFRINIDEELAKKINDKFIVEGEAPVVKAGESLFDFASARNYAALLPENNMIATPDCDEIYTKMDIDKLDKAVEDGYQQFEYNFVFSHDAQGNAVIKFRHCKFYDRRKLKWTGIIHEVLTGDAKKLFFEEDIIKLEHYQNETTNRSGYIKGLAIDCFNNPDNDRNSHYFAREMYYLGRFKSAIKEFKRHIAMDKWATEAAQSMLYVGDCYKKLGDFGEMLKWYSLSVDKELRREPLMRLAEYYYGKGMQKQAIAYAEAALTVTQLPFYSNHQPYYENGPHELLYVSYWNIDKAKSKEHWKKAIGFAPSNPKYLEDAKWYKDNPEEFTGERYIPGINRPDMEAEHYARYNFAVPFTEGKVVLDAACGVAYGKDILKAKEYIGIDIEPGEGIIVQDLEKGIDLDIKPDVVVSFETIEHLENPVKFLQWVKDNCKQFIFSIPVSMPSEFHKQVYTIEEIKELIGHFFPVVKYYEQNAGEITEESGNAKYIVGVAEIEPELPEREPVEPKISFIIPTLGREEGLERCTKSIQMLNYPEDKIEIIIVRDSFEDRIGVPKLVKRGLKLSTGDWIVFASNDTEFTPESINEALKVGEKGYVAFNTGEVSADEGNINEHFMIHKSIIKVIGDIFDTDFWHVGVDNLLWAKMKKLGIAKRADKAIVIHNHFTKGAEMDKTYKVGWDVAKVGEDRALLAKKLEELKQ